MSIPAHVVPRQAGDDKAEHDRTVYSKQLLLGRYLDPWGPPDIVWCHSHSLVRGLKVILNVYDLLPPRLNGLLAALRLGGAFHSGIQVGPTEYAFGGHPNDDLGITALRKPLFMLRKEAEEAVRQGEDEYGTAAANLEWMPTLRSRTVVGWWMGPLSELELLLRELRFDELWAGSGYRLLSRNCNHFARSMCAAMLRNPLFKAAPGCMRPEDLVPRSVTRLPALVLALGSCAPCLVRRLNAPIPLASHALHIFQGQARKPVPEAAWLRSSRSTRLQPHGGGGRRARSASVSTPLKTSAATAAGAGGGGNAAGVRQSSSSSVASVAGLRIGSSVVGGWSPGAAPPAAAAAAAAAAVEGRLLRPRVLGRYESLRVETVQQSSSAECNSLALGRRRAEDGGGGGSGGGGADTPAGDHGTGCSTPDLAAVSTAGPPVANGAATAGGGGGGAVSPVLHTGLANGHSRQWSKPEMVPGSPFPSVTAAAAAAAGHGTAPDAAITTTSPTTTTAVAPAGLCPGPPTGSLSASLPPPMHVMEAASSAAYGTPAVSAAAASTVSTATVTPPAQRTSAVRFLNNSRSGRRVFPDPRVAPLGPEGHGDAAHETVGRFSIDGDRGGGGGGGGGGPPRWHAPDVPPPPLPPQPQPQPREWSQAELELGPPVAAAPARGAEPQPGPRSHPTGFGPSPGPSPRQAPSSSWSQQLHPTPRCSASGGLPPLALQAPLLLPRPECSPNKPSLPTQLQHQQQHQHHQQQHQNQHLQQHQHQHQQQQQQQQQQQLHQQGQHQPLPVTSGPTADGCTAAAAAAASQQSPSEAPRPWSVLSGGFVDLLFSPSATTTTTEPPPGVPNPVAISRSGTGTGSGAGAGGSNSRRYSSFTGDGGGGGGGGGLFSGVSNATGGGGGLEPVASGDLSEEMPQQQQSPNRAAALRVRASTGMIGTFVVGGEAGGGGGAPAMSPPAPSGMGAAAAAAASPLLLRPSVAGSRGGSVGVGTGHGHGSAGSTVASAPSMAAAAVAAVAAADGNGTTSPVGRRGAF